MSICPKNKSSKARRDKRRANWKMSAPNLVKCSKCGEYENMETEIIASVIGIFIRILCQSAGAENAQKKQPDIDKQEYTKDNVSVYGKQNIRYSASAFRHNYIPLKYIIESTYDDITC